MNTRPANVDDALPVAEVHIASWRSAYAGILPDAYLASLSVESRAGNWKDILMARESSTIVAEVDCRVLGFASYGKCRDEDVRSERAEIWALYVAPEAWGQGVGRALMLQATEELTALGFQETSLWVLSRNLRGIRFYDAWGFASVEGSQKQFELGGVAVEEVSYLWHHDA